jgi:hypothetical protein
MKGEYGKRSSSRRYGTQLTRFGAPMDDICNTNALIPGIAGFKIADVENP